MKKVGIYDKDEILKRIPLIFAHEDYCHSTKGDYINYIFDSLYNIGNIIYVKYKCPICSSMCVTVIDIGDLETFILEGVE